MTIKFLDTFAGIGGVRMGLEQALNEIGIDHECVGTIEYDKNPCKTYSNNFEKIDPTDITKVDIKSLPNFDMLLGGFPCQSFSINGKWYVKNSCTLGNDERNNLVFYLFEILKEKNPKYFLFENVKELTTIKNLDGTLFFDTIKENLNGLGYNVYTSILDTNNFGVPQQRKRVFFIGVRKDIDKKGYKFPQGNKNITCIKDILQNDSEIDEKYYLDIMWKNRTCSGGGNKPELKGRNRLDVLKELYGTGKWEQAMNLKTPSGKIEPISIIYGDTPSNLARQGDKIYSIYGIAPTIATFSVSIPKVNTKRWRQLTPRECMRLQGFPDSYKIDKNDTLAYKQAGNSVSVPVIKNLLINLFK